MSAQRVAPPAPLADQFMLTLWTADPELAASADAAGVDRVGVDMEHLGKRQRQADLGTWISPHTVEDLAVVGPALRDARLFARVNPLNPESERELERALEAGVQVVMLPMFTTAEEVAEFVRLLAGRAEPVLLLEQVAAIERIEEIVDVPGVREIHIGVNDLSLDMSLGNRFAVLVSEDVERVAEATLRGGLRFGLGGLGRVDDTTLPIPADLLYAQHARLGSTAALISRRFRPAADGSAGLATAVHAMRDRLRQWQSSREDELTRACHELRVATAATGAW